MARGHQKQARFTVYLIKDELSKASDILKPPSDSYPVRLGGRRLGTLYLRAPGRNKPSWLSLFAEAVEGLPKTLFNQHTAAVLLLSVKGRSFAVTFGYGWALLRLEATQDKFGLRVALNSIDPEKIKSVDRTRLDALTSKTRSQSTMGGTQDQFGIRPEQDLLRAIVGIPRERDLGSPIAGAESLQLHLPADITKLPLYLEKALERHESTAYREHFEWIDYVSVVRDPSVRTKLEENLSQAVAARDFSAMYLAIPDIIDWQETSGFRYTDGGKIFDDVHVSTLLESIRGSSDLDMNTLRSRRIRQIGRVSDAEIGKWSVFRCVNFETALGGKTCLLTAGEWYLVDDGFVQRTLRRVKRIPLATVSLPPYDDDDEEAYNTRAALASHDDLVCLDRKTRAYGGGRSAVEFCDLYSRQGTMIHVKRYTGSPTLSHLFAQGIVPALALLRDADFRVTLNDSVLPASHRLRRPQSRPDARQHPIVYAIVSSSTEDIRDSLPFFSKVALVAAVERLSEASFPVQLAKIENRRRPEVAPAPRRRTKRRSA